MNYLTIYLVRLKIIEIVIIFAYIVFRKISKIGNAYPAKLSDVSMHLINLSQQQNLDLLCFSVAVYSYMIIKLVKRNDLKLRILFI